MKRNHIILALVASVLLLFAGALLRILHWPLSGELQLAGMLAGVVGVGGLLLKMLAKPKH